MTKLSLELEYEKFTVEFKNIDVDGEQYMRALLSLMIGATFSENTVLNAMDDFLTSYDYKDSDKEEQDETQEIT
jgi:hypothetical protein